MATNTNNNRRKGVVKDRSQFKNESNGTNVKRDTNTGKFIGAKKGEAYKGVRKEK